MKTSQLRGTIKILLALVVAIVSFTVKAEAILYDFESGTMPSEFNLGAVYNPPYWATPTSPANILDPVQVNITDIRSFEGSRSLSIGTTWTNTPSVTTVMIPINYQSNINISWAQYDQHAGQSAYYMMFDLLNQSNDFIYRIANNDYGWLGTLSNNTYIVAGANNVVGPRRTADSWSTYEVNISNETVSAYINNYLVNTYALPDKVSNIAFQLPYYCSFLGPQSYQIDNLNIESDLQPVPEPSTFLLLGAGIAGIGIWRRKKISTL